MRRESSLMILLLTLLAPFGWAQLQVNSTLPTQQNRVSGSTLYDDFNQRWLDPAKWLPQNPNCWGNVLECAREIRDGKLRLAVRNFGATDSDSGIQFSESEVYFQNPNPITSITADVTDRFSGVGCATNDTDRTHSQVMFGGSFFNMGSSAPDDDMVVWLIIWIDTVDPTNMNVSVYWGHPWPGQAIDVGFANYPVGTPLVATLTWDKANHQFIGKTRKLGEWESVQQVQIPYSVPDTLPPASPLKSLQASQHTLNCTSGNTYGQLEATYDNVLVKR